MTTDRQSDQFGKYKNPEVVAGNGVEGYARVIAQLKNNRWAIWEAAFLWGGVLEKRGRLRDGSGSLASFANKQDAIKFSNSVR